jgi:hypothetical protein
MLTLIAISTLVIALCLAVQTLIHIRVALTLKRAEDELHGVVEEVRKSLHGLQGVAERSKAVVRGLETSAGKVMDGLEVSAGVVQEAAERLSRLSTLVVDEVEPPVRSTVALAHGVRVGADALLGRLRDRLTGRGTATDGYRPR